MIYQITYSKEPDEKNDAVAKAIFFLIYQMILKKADSNKCRNTLRSLLNIVLEKATLELSNNVWFVIIKFPNHDAIHRFTLTTKNDHQTWRFKRPKIHPSP
jgi:hypothetical protein